MWCRLLSLLVLGATAVVAGWIALRGVVWVDRESWLIALASGWEIVAIGLLLAMALWSLAGLQGHLRVLTVGVLATLLALVLVRDVRPWRPGAGAPGEVAVEQPATRTLWMCVDGLSWSRVLPLVEAGRMPRLKALLEAGSSAVLESHRTYRESVDRWGWWSPVVWTTLATGRSARAHGITDFSLPDPTRPVRRNGTPRRLAASSVHRKVPAVWNIFSAFGRRVGVVGWWATWPAEEVDGLIVADRVGLRSRKALNDLDPPVGVEWFGGQKHLTYPPSALQWLTEDVGLPGNPADWIDRKIFPFGRYPIVNQDELATIHAVLWQDELYVRAAETLMRTRRDLDLTTVYIEGVDVLSHQFWRFLADPEAEPELSLPAGFEGHRRIVDRYLERLDGYVGRLLDAAGEPVRVVLTSDHGFRLTPRGEFPADHSAFGTLVLAGDGVRRGETALTLAGAVVGSPSVMDVLPTILYWNGLPIADELEGRPLFRFFERSYVAGHAAVRIETYGDFAESRTIEVPSPDASDEEYLERLKALGYIE